MTKKTFEYWGVYDGGVPATPRGPKKFVEQMAGMLSNPGGQGRRVCIAKAEKGGLGEAQTGVCYIDGARQKIRRPRPASPTTAAVPCEPVKPE